MGEPVGSEKYSTWSESPGAMSHLFSLLSLFVGVGLLAWGLYSTYAYDETMRLVGGDAYNLQIIATRGVALICCGVAGIVAAAVHELYAIRATLLSR